MQGNWWPSSYIIDATENEKHNDFLGRLENRKETELCVIGYSIWSSRFGVYSEYKTYKHTQLCEEFYNSKNKNKQAQLRAVVDRLAV